MSPTLLSCLGFIGMSPTLLAENSWRMNDKERRASLVFKHLIRIVWGCFKSAIDATIEAAAQTVYDAVS
jgi:hypothetical protein